MDDFRIASLQESRNEWVSRLVNILTPHIMDGFKFIFTEFIISLLLVIFKIKFKL